MLVQGYFDGTAVRMVDPVDLRLNQTVYISIYLNDVFLRMKSSAYGLRLRLWMMCAVCFRRMRRLP